MIPIVLIIFIVVFFVLNKSYGDVAPKNIGGTFEPDETLVQKGRVFQSSITSLSKKYGFEPAMIAAQAVVESAVNANAIGDGGKSKGIMQIQKPAWEDGANYINKSNYVYDTSWHIAPTNVEVAIGYHLFNANKSGVGDGDFLLRAYNGGLKGANSTAAKDYAKKVWAYYNAIKGVT